MRQNEAVILSSQVRPLRFGRCFSCAAAGLGKPEERWLRWKWAQSDVRQSARSVGEPHRHPAAWPTADARAAARDGKEILQGEREILLTWSCCFSTRPLIFSQLFGGMDSKIANKRVVPWLQLRSNKTVNDSFYDRWQNGQEGRIVTCFVAHRSLYFLTNWNFYFSVVCVYVTAG